MLVNKNKVFKSTAQQDQHNMRLQLGANLMYQL